MFTIQQALARVLTRTNLNDTEMQDIFRSIMTGELTPAQIGGFLIGLRIKGETVEEIAAAAKVMRSFALKVDVAKDKLVDIVGTGGDGMHTFNISTTAAFVVAAAGARVAKHNNRSISSRSGSADVLDMAGVKLGLPPDQVARCIEEVGIGFMFAPAHHSATKYAAGPRKELGVRTVFNLLGPLTNPAGAPNLLLGVYAKELVTPIAEVMQALGSHHVLVVHSDDGLDEISIAAPSNVAELKDGKISAYTLTPEQFGLQRGKLADIKVDSIDHSFAMVQGVLANQPGPARDIVVLNAGAAIYAAGVAGTLEQGIRLAEKTLADGSAKQKLDQLVALTGKLAGKP